MTRILPLALSLVLAGLIALAAGIGDFGAAGDWLFSHPWGWVTLADLYAGFILIALVIGFFERSWVKRLVWIAPLFVLGNVWAALWLAWRRPNSCAASLALDGGPHASHVPVQPWQRTASNPNCRILNGISGGTGRRKQSLKVTAVESHGSDTGAFARRSGVRAWTRHALDWEWSRNPR